MSLFSLTTPTREMPPPAGASPALAGQITPPPLQVTLTSSGGHLPEFWSSSVAELRTICRLRIGPHPAQPTVYSRCSHTSFLCPHGGPRGGQRRVSWRSLVVISPAAPAPGSLSRCRTTSSWDGRASGWGASLLRTGWLNTGPTECQKQGSLSLITSRKGKRAMVHHPAAQTPLSDIAFNVIISFKKPSSWHLSRDGRSPKVGGRSRECSGHRPKGRRVAEACHERGRWTDGSSQGPGPKEECPQNPGWREVEGDRQPAGRSGCSRVCVREPGRS